WRCGVFISCGPGAFDLIFLLSFPELPNKWYQSPVSAWWGSGSGS
ncbi:hypothetical protein A2U01_0076463, partial [Trifolium medium]|nr:hypothetical protein [Trifolium medium]